MSTATPVKSLLSPAPLDELLRLFPGVLLQQRPDLGIAFATARIGEFTGLTAEEWPRQPAARFWEVVHETDAAPLRKQLDYAARTGQAVTTLLRLRHGVTRRVTCVQEHRQARRNQAGSLLGYDVVWLDATSDILAGHRRPRAVGVGLSARLADVLVHDINNLLTGIHTMSESFQVQLAAGHPFQEGLGLIRGHVLQAKEAVQRLRDWGAGSAGARAHHNLNDLVIEAVELARRILTHNPAIELVPAPEALPVFADAAELRRVILELTWELASRLPPGGRLRVETTRRRQRPPGVKLRGEPPALPCLCLTVTFPSAGVDAQLAEEWLEPLASARPLGHAGVERVIGITHWVERNGGTLSLETAATETTLGVWLPEADFSERNGPDRRP